MKSLGTRTRQRALRLNTKNTIQNKGNNDKLD